MNKVTTVLDAVTDVIKNVRALADSLQGFADALTEIKGIETSKEPVAQISEKETKPKKEKAKTYTLEDVRRILGEKSVVGYRAEVQELVFRYNAKRLSEIDPKYYAEIIKEVEAIGNE